MAAPTRLNACVNLFRKSCFDLKHSGVVFSRTKCCEYRTVQRFQSTFNGYRHKSEKSKWYRSGCSLSLFSMGSVALAFGGWKVYASDYTKPEITPSRKVVIPTDNHGLKLTLFQYQTCPFCCKVRAYLDYHGFSYDVVEVNSVTRKQLKWSKYRKVPLLVLDGVGEDGFLVLRDSCVIVSLLESFLEDPSHPLDKLASYYPCIESKERGRKKYDFPNKYFVMYREEVLKSIAEERKDERDWRQWTDDVLIHMLSPNVYRTPSEALQAFRNFSDVGEWEKNFSTTERHVIIYVGAAVMYILGRMIKKKYKLKDDVRQSLYDNCNMWVAALGPSRQFMGGASPNMADLAVYGVLNSIDGCDAFHDMVSNTDIEPWYRNMKSAVTSHDGAHPLFKKS